MDKLTYIKQNFENMTDIELASNLETTAFQIKKLRIQNQLFQNRNEPWTRLELEKLAQKYPNAEWDDLIWIFDRSKDSIMVKANSENIYRSEDRIKEARGYAGRITKN